jgi:putative transposase
MEYTKMAMKTNDLKDLAKELVKQYKTRDALFGKDGVVKDLQRHLYNAALNGELTDHLGFDEYERTDKAKENTRNGYSKKTVRTDTDTFDIDVPRDRAGTYEPILVEKRQTRVKELDDKILWLYRRGASTTEIQSELEDLYGINLSTSLISNVTASVLDDLKAWQSRPLDRLYPIVYLDCLVVKAREDKRIIRKSVYLALGVNLEGQKELLGIWLSENEGAKFWLGVLTELKNRGLEDMLIACVDGLSGFPEAIEAVYPKTQVQLCIVHMVRNSLKYVGWKDRRQLASDLKTIYAAKTVEEAESALTAFADKWDSRYPHISQSWLNRWENITPFFAYPEDIRKAIYTTNAIESLNMTLRNVIKRKRVFPNESSILKVLYLSIDHISKKWTMPIKNWSQAMNWFMIEFDNRITA